MKKISTLSTLNFIKNETYIISRALGNESFERDEFDKALDDAIHHAKKRESPTKHPLKLARRLLGLIKKKGTTELSERDALRALDGNGLTMDELRPALVLLVDGEWLRHLPAPETRTGRPPSPRYLVVSNISRPDGP